MIHPHTSVVHVSVEVGLGVIANRRISRGTITWTQDHLDRVFTLAETGALNPPHRALLDRYAYVDADNNRILCWDAGRLVNHSCEPTMRGMGPWFMVARRDVEAGEEVTCDYAECNLDPALECRCGHPTCRGMVHGRDLLRFGEMWDQEVVELREAARLVEQPLLPYLIEPAAAMAMLSGDAPIPSFISQCAFAAGTR